MMKLLTKPVSFLSAAKPASAAVIAALIISGCSPQETENMQEADMASVSSPAYPDWHGQWHQANQRLQWPTQGYEQDGPPPLNDEYMARWQQVRDDQAAGIPPDEPTQRCLPQGMPRIMKAVYPLEIIITPEITYIYAEWNSQFRRIFTDGRDWPGYILPSFNGYSIGEWHDEDNDGVYDALLVETRAIKGPRLYDGQLVPFHDNNETVILEEFRLLDDMNMQNTITSIDDALTEPWVVSQYYRRQLDDIIWAEYACMENNSQLKLGDEWYFINDDGTLDPTREGQPRLVPEVLD